MFRAALLLALIACAAAAPTDSTNLAYHLARAKQQQQHERPLLGNLADTVNAAFADGMGHPFAHISWESRREILGGEKVSNKDLAEAIGASQAGNVPASALILAADLESPQAREAEKSARRREITVDRKANPEDGTQLNIVALGGDCSGNWDMCAAGLYCNSLDKCVGPAATGDSCIETASGFMCETGSYCQCVKLSNETKCSCMAEVKKGDACKWDFECPIGYFCNNVSPYVGTDGTCTLLGSLKADTKASHPALCEFGLMFAPTTGADNEYEFDKTLTYECKDPTTMSCSSQSDCQPFPSRFWLMYEFYWADNIYFTCQSGKCAFTGPKCSGTYKQLVQADAGQPLHMWDAGKLSQASFTDKYYKHFVCMYKDQTSGIKSSSTAMLDIYLVGGSYISGSEPRGLQTSFVDVGGSVDTTKERCKYGLYITADGKCAAFPAAGDKCASWFENPYDFILCGPGLVCSKSTNIGASTAGTCVAPADKQGAACSRSTWYNHTTNEYINTNVACDYSKKLGCNYKAPKMQKADGTHFQEGTCTEFFSLKQGTMASSSEFCGKDLFMIPSATPDITYGECDTLLKVSCTYFYECSEVFPNNVATYETPHLLNEDSDGFAQQVNPFVYFAYGYDDYTDYAMGTGEVRYPELIAATAMCSGGKCTGSVSAEKCSLTLSSQFAADAGAACATTKCLLKGMTADKFNVCNGAAAMQSSLAIVAAVVALVFFAF